MSNLTKEQQYKINMIAVLIDLQDQYLSELAPEFKQGMKQLVNKASKHTKHFIRECDRVFSEENSLDFGEVSDELRELIEDKIKLESKIQKL